MPANSPPPPNGPPPPNEGPPPDAPAAARAFADRSAARPPGEEGAFPTAALAELHRLGLTTAPLAPERGGSHLGVAAGRWAAMLTVCRRLGRADLTLARLYEGHANGVQLVETFGSEELKEAFAADVRTGALSAIWNTERPGHALRFVPAPQADDSSSPRVALNGGKVFCSGAAHAARPVVCGTLTGDRGGWQMAVVPLDRVPHAMDPAGWAPLGVRGTGTYSVRFEPGASIPAGNLLGAPGDYLREPWLTAGAARFLAAQVGACEGLLELVRSDLWIAKRTDHPGQRARAAELARLVARGRLWLDGLGERVAAWLDREEETDRLVAFTRAARTEIEELSHDVLRLASQCVGLRGMVAPHPLERRLRDLTTYLRQPALDTSAEGVGRFTLDGSHGLFAGELFDPDPVAADEGAPCPNRRLRGTPLERPGDAPAEPAAWVRTLGRTAVIAPHPDDEALGVGGVIASLRDAGLPVGVLFLTDGEASHPGSRSHPPPALAELRRSEARAACDLLGVNPDAVRFLALPDGGVPRAGGEGFDIAADAVRRALTDLPDGPPHTVLTPWRREPHGDHRAAFDLATAAAGGARVIEYAVHLWQVRDPADVPRFDGDAPEVVPVRVDVSSVLNRKRAAIAAHASQTTGLIADSPAGFRLPEEWRAACERPSEVLLLPPDGRPSATVPTEYFTAKYDRAADPWDFAGSPYEAAKYAATLAALPRGRYRRGLELGCSVGVLTERLAARCDALLAVDAAPAAVERTRDRCRDLSNVTAGVAVLPGDWPRGSHDLIVASEVCYYWSDADFAAARRALRDGLEPGGHLLLVHWTVYVPDYPRTGDAVHEAFLADPDLKHVAGRREPFYRLDLFTPR